MLKIFLNEKKILDKNVQKNVHFVHFEILKVEKLKVFDRRLSCMHIHKESYKCLCGRITRTKGGMTKHLVDCKMNNKPIECSNCLTRFDTQISFLKHYHKCMKKRNKEHRKLCEICNFYSDKISNYKKHLASKKHMNNVRKYELSVNQCNDFENEDECDDYSDNMYDIEHTITVIADEPTVKMDNESQIENETMRENDDELKLMFKKIINDNQKLHLKLDQQNYKMSQIQSQQHEIRKIASEPKNIQQNNFNVLNYLNSECRDALNIYEFIDSLPIDIKHCKAIAEEGYLKPFEDVFVQALEDLDQRKRPIHCTDLKRNSSYIKNYNNEWVRDKENEELENAFDYLQHKQVVEFRKHKNKNPNWIEDDGNLDFFNNFVCNVYKMNQNKDGSGEKLIKKLVSSTLKRNKLIKDNM